MIEFNLFVNSTSSIIAYRFNSTMFEYDSQYKQSFIILTVDFPENIGPRIKLISPQ